MRDDVHMTAATAVPPYHELLWPALLAVDELGGSASIGEMVEAVVKRERFTDDQQAVLHNDGPETEIGYRLAWARNYLKGMGLLTNSARGVWALTDAGAALLNDPTDERAKRERVRALWSEHVAHLRSKDRRRKSAEAAGVGGSWRSRRAGLEGATARPVDVHATGQFRAAGAAPTAGGGLRQCQRHREER